MPEAGGGTSASKVRSEFLAADGISEMGVAGDCAPIGNPIEMDRTHAEEVIDIIEKTTGNGFSPGKEMDDR